VHLNGYQMQFNHFGSNEIILLLPDMTVAHTSLHEPAIPMMNEPLKLR
jgi:hypothetical protein